MYLIKQISIFVENKPGRLKAMTNILKDNDINIRALSIAETIFLMSNLTSEPFLLIIFINNTPFFTHFLKIGAKKNTFLMFSFCLSPRLFCVVGECLKYIIIELIL